MKCRRIAVTGLAAAAVIGSTGPAWAFWTLTSNPTSTAGAKADSLPTPAVQSSRTGNGSNIQVHFRIAASPGAVPDRFTVSRKAAGSGTTYTPLAGCIDVLATTTCTASDSENNGAQTYRIFTTAGTFWFSGVSVCQYLNNNNGPSGPNNLSCTALVGPIAPLAGRAAPSDSTAGLSSGGSKSTATPTETPAADPAPTSTAPEPTPTPTPEATPAPTLTPAAPDEAAVDDTGTSEPAPVEPAPAATDPADNGGAGTSPAQAVDPVATG